MYCWCSFHSTNRGLRDLNGESRELICQLAVILYLLISNLRAQVTVAISC